MVRDAISDISWQADVLMNLRLIAKYAREIRDALVPEADAKERAQAAAYSCDDVKSYLRRDDEAATDEDDSG